MTRLPAPGTPLTCRQLQIVGGIARGRSNGQIGAALGLSADGVRAHVSRILRATGECCRAGIVDHAYRTGLLKGLPPEPRPPVTLTLRRRQVLASMAAGLTNAQIGRQLGIAEETVRTAAHRLFAQLGATDRAHAVALGWQHGLLDAGTPACASPAPQRALGAPQGAQEGT
ncbi:helix-turn-helix transcriptional regulator [Streptomyces sp. NPDC051173]|uniref:response regulator transcription factor n=1 Tax=Streptomyces sp. NPDC051173 TaxID=3155164 RepID=UPI0034500D33